MKCLRCGICCTKHQAIINFTEAERIAAYLDITAYDLKQLYSEPNWHSEKSYLLRQVDGACIFLKYNNNTTCCAIQPVKPSCCTDWMPGLDKKECSEGLKQC